jgi:HEAT repeat protein
MGYDAHKMGDFGPFRPLRPYTEADRSLFFGRERELGELVERLSGDRQSALLLGESGIGKTSLVRAGLVPTLKARGVSCAYVEANTLDESLVPQGSPGGTLLVIDDLGAMLDEGPRFDKLIAVLKRAGGVRGMKILFVIDEEDLYRLDALEKLIGHVAPLAQRVRLERLDEARVGDIVERTVLGGGAYFEAGLSHEIAVDLCRNGSISPSELQLVASTAVALHLNTLRAFRRSGGAEVLAWRFFDRACSLAGAAAKRPAARVLAELAARERRGIVARDELARAAGVDDSAADKLAAVLAHENLVDRSGDGYALSSEWVRPLARAYTGEAHGRGVAARLLLRRKIEGGGLLRPGELREIRHYAGTLAADEEAVVKRSKMVSWAVTAAILAVPIVTLVLLYASYRRSVYLDAAPGPGGSVVARLGRPGNTLAGFFPHSPSFGSVIADSGFSRAALKAGVPDGTEPRAGDAWLRRLMSSLKPVSQAAVALILDGDAQPLVAAYEDSSLRPALLEVVGAAGRGGPDELSLLRKAQADASEDIRRRVVEAAAALERRIPGSGVDFLAGGMKDQSPTVRALALQEIQRLPDEQATKLLTQALAVTADPVTRQNALDEIGARVQRTPQVAGSLGDAMRGPARPQAVAILGRIIDQPGPAADAAADAIAKVALDPKAPEEARIDALKLLRHREKTPAGIETVTGSPRLQAAAMPLLVRGNPEEAQAKVAEAMKGPAPLRAAAAAAIGLLPKTADTPQKLKVLQYDSSQEVHAEAVRALPVLGRDALPLLVKEAKGSTAEIERAAVETIGSQAGKLGGPAAAQALETIVKGARPSTRKAAIEALGRIAEQKPALAAGSLGRLVRDKVADVRADAAGALGDVLLHGGKEAVTALKSVSKDPDPATRKRAAGALGRAKGPLASSAAHALQAFTADPDTSVRLDAAVALGALGAAARDGAPIAALVGDKDPAVRSAARKAAQAIGGNGADLDKILIQSFAGAPAGDRVEIATTAGIVGAPSTVRAALADSDAAVRRAAAEHAGGLGAQNVSALLAALGDPDMAVRVAAVRGLVGAKAGPELARAARSPDLEVRAAALQALGEVGGSAARPTLEAALSDASERVRVAAARGLGLLGNQDQQVGELLAKALHDPARDVREAAAAALGSVWAALPAGELRLRLSDETDADRRIAAALALARQSDGAKGEESKKVLDEVANNGTPAVRLTARLARAFIGRADALVGFLRLVHDGA